MDQNEEISNITLNVTSMLHRSTCNVILFTSSKKLAKKKYWLHPMVARQGFNQEGINKAPEEVVRFYLGEHKNVHIYLDLLFYMYEILKNHCQLKGAYRIYMVTDLELLIKKVFIIFPLYSKICNENMAMIILVNIWKLQFKKINVSAE